MTPYYQDDQVSVYSGDCLDVMARLPDASVDAVITDPPYGLDFMGKHWDTGAVAFHVDTWAHCLRLLKPGGHLLAFGGTRTWHRLTCAIEDAGFEIRDSIAWLYGSGFPKSLDVSKALDKRGGNAHLATAIGEAIKAARVLRGWTVGQADQHFCGGSTQWSWYEGRKGGYQTPSPAAFTRIAAEWPELASFAALVTEVKQVDTGQVKRAGIGFVSKPEDEKWVSVTAPATDAAKRWQGWGTSLKPAFEPIVVARKPIRGTVAANVVEHGTGAINIDAARVGDRWPPNVATDSPVSEVFPVFRYTAKADAEQRPTANGISHPTVKPLDLMRWLVRLVTPPNAVVLDPFAGSGTTAEACVHEYKRCIAIEREPDYLPLIVARLSKPMAVGFDFGEPA